MGERDHTIQRRSDIKYACYMRFNRLYSQISFNPHYILIIVGIDDTDIITSTTISLPNANIEEIYQKTINLCRKKYLLFWDNWKITYSLKPYHILLKGIPYAFPFPRAEISDSSKWEIIFSQNTNQVHVKFSLIKRDKPFWGLSEDPIAFHMYPQIALYLIRGIGVEVTDDVLRTIYSEDLLDYHIKITGRTSLILGSVTLTISFIGYHYSLRNVFLIALLPAYGFLWYLNKSSKLKSIKRHIYF